MAGMRLPGVRQVRKFFNSRVVLILPFMMGTSREQRLSEGLCPE